MLIGTIPAIATPCRGQSAATADGVWSQLPPPTPRWHHSMVFDPVRNRMIVFGGLRTDFYIRLDDVWVLSLTGTPHWNVLATEGPGPSARFGQSAIYDPIGD